MGGICSTASVPECRMLRVLMLKICCKCTHVLDMNQEMILNFVGGCLKLKVNAKWEQAANCVSELF